MIQLLATKPLLIAGLALASVSATAAGAVLQQRQPATSTVRVVPTVITLPGSQTTIIQTVTVRPRQPGHNSQPAGHPSPQPGTGVPQPAPAVTVTSRPRPGPTVTHTVTSTPAPGPSARCTHPPRRKCRHRPGISVSISASVGLP